MKRFGTFVKEKLCINNFPDSHETVFGTSQIPATYVPYKKAVFQGLKTFFKALKVKLSFFLSNWCWKGYRNLRRSPTKISSFLLLYVHSSSTLFMTQQKKITTFLRWCNNAMIRSGNTDSLVENKRKLS